MAQNEIADCDIEWRQRGSDSAGSDANACSVCVCLRKLCMCILRIYRLVFVYFSLFLYIIVSCDNKVSTLDLFRIEMMEELNTLFFPFLFLLPNARAYIEYHVQSTRMNEYYTSKLLVYVEEFLKS